MHPEFKQLINHPLKFRMFLIKNLPSAYFSGVRVVEITREHCVVKVPYKWFSTNPFNSTYFACLAMAAEMSTGVLALGNIYKKKPAVSMLVRKMEAEFLKKATGDTNFTCTGGAAIECTINKAIETRNSQELVTESIGKNRKGETIAIFKITWGFKAKI